MAQDMNDRIEARAGSRRLSLSDQLRSDLPPIVAHDDVSRITVRKNPKRRRHSET